MRASSAGAYARLGRVHLQIVGNGARRSRRFDVARSLASADYSKFFRLLTPKRRERRAPRSRQLADELVLGAYPVVRPRQRRYDVRVEFFGLGCWKTFAMEKTLASKYRLEVTLAGLLCLSERALKWNKQRTYAQIHHRT